MNIMTVNGYHAKIEHDEELAIQAQAQGKSIKMPAQEALQERIAH